MSYQDGQKPSGYSPTSEANDPFNPPQLGYGHQEGGVPHPATGGGQYQPYYDTESDIGARYEGGGMGRETWASESAWSGNGRFSSSTFLRSGRLCVFR